MFTFSLKSAELDSQKCLFFFSDGTQNEGLGGKIKKLNSCQVVSQHVSYYKDLNGRSRIA